MKQTLRRFFYYAFVLSFLVSIFDAWPSLHPGPISLRLGRLIGFAVAMLFWMIVFEAAFRAVRWERRRRE